MNLSEQLTSSDVELIVRQLGIELNGKLNSAGFVQILSPLREERKASFSIDPETGIWKDFGTDESGDLITLVEQVRGLSNSEAVKWVAKLTDLTTENYTPSKNGRSLVNKKPKPEPDFWTDERLNLIKSGIQQLKSEINHQLLTTALEYDCLKLETLQGFGCGIIDQWGKEWLAFPYSSGCQLYRRENGEKVIRSVKGSVPGVSYFGLKLCTGKSILLIAKSPRETMLLSQEYGDRADVLGLATGEQGTVSKEQRSILSKQISASNYSHIYTFLDCDTDNAYKTAKSFTVEIFKALETKFDGGVSLINIHKSTGEVCKDITDCLRDGMDRDMIEALFADAIVVTGTESVEQEEGRPTETERVVSVDDFYSYAPENKYIFVPTRELWPSSSVKQRVPSPKKDTSVTEWLSQNRSVEQMTWIPGEGMLIKDKLVSNGGWFDAPGLTTFNLYHPPTIDAGNPKKATPWVKHVQRVYPEQTNHLIGWFAHRVQNPGEKVNHAIIMGGSQGIGKDTILAPVQQAVGPWNCSDVTPNQLMGRFNGFIKSVILRVSEARDMGDVDRYSLYEHLKIYTASPPEVLRCDEKNRREYGVLNVCGVVITTNHKAGGIYLPADDRRHFVAWSERTKDDFNEEYWRKLWSWYEEEGFRHVTAYLQGVDLANFDPKAPPPKTDGFWEIVNASRAPEDAEMADALEQLGKPDAVTIDSVAKAAGGDFYDWLNDRRNRRQIPHRFETSGYVPIRSETTQDGRWKVAGKNVVIYAKRDLSKRDRIVAAQKLTREA